MKIIGSDLPNIPWEPKPKKCVGPMWRFSGNPIIGWNPMPGVARIFNSAVVAHNGAFVGAFRTEHTNGVPVIHFGRSKDGLKWDIDEKDIDWRDEKGKPFPTTYAYDPRFMKIDGIFYAIWCTDFDGGGPTIGLGMTKDFKKWTRLPNVFIPFNRNGVLFPRKINGEYYMLSRPSDTGHTPFGDIFLSRSKDLIYWGRHALVMKRGGGWWQGMKIGAGPAPIETDEGWLLFYHGVVNTCNGYVYSAGAALLDLEDPSKVIYRSSDYLLTPEKEYEVAGFVPNVCFPCAALTDAKTGRIAIYYGAADTYTAIAFTTVEETLSFIKKKHL
jgi:beta-1,4-mannooligosaccharide/beta-1,4-mannosyl-N-acetylglucosamine phosphorylase